MIYQPYQYAVIRYIPDVFNQEFFNIGVIVKLGDQYAHKIAVDNIDKLKHTFSHITDEGLNLIEMQDKVFCSKIGDINQNIFYRNADFQGGVQYLLSSNKMNSIQLSEVSEGVSNLSLQDILGQIFEQVVRIRSKTPHERRHRSTHDAVNSFKSKLKSRNILEKFEPYKVRGEIEKYEVPLSYQNGKRHIIDPVSFDLDEEKDISHRAYIKKALLGNLDFNNYLVYLPVIVPQNDDLAELSNRAINYIQKGTSIQVVREYEIDSFADKLSDLVVQGHD